MSIRKKHITFVLWGLVAVLTVACSAQKNTAKSRWWHSFNSRYNAYYNGAQAYISGSLDKESGNKDNYTEIIPLYPVGNKESRTLGSGNFDKAIEKSQKIIKLHSIKKKPEWTKNRRKTAKDIEWLNRKEYNPFMWKAWMLMGRSQFHKGAFDEAAATFNYMSRLYQTQPAIYGKARAWLAKCYIEQEWLYDAEDVMRNMERDSIDWHARKEWDYTYADYYIHTHEYEKAIPYLRKVIKHEMRRKQRAREWFLMGQLLAELGRKDEAYKAYRKVLKQNPPYELAFNARIAMTEVTAQGNGKKMISRLKRMAASDNNKEYLDQVYYAMGNIYMAQNDTAHAIGAYEKGHEKATRNGVEHGVLLLRLGDIYWELEKFSDAQRCYGAAVGMLDKERKDYEQLSNRSKILDGLVPYTDAIHLQDSLLALSTMSEADRNAAIDRVIEALKKKEKEEKKAQQEAEAEKVMAQNSAMGSRNNTQRPATPQMTNQQDGLWYFYNQMAVNQGKQTFQKQWGKRENADNWQRVNQTVVGGIGENGSEDELPNDSTSYEEEPADSVGSEQDSLQNDPHNREYYLAQIPFTEEQKAASHDVIKEGLYNSGVIFKDQLDNLRLSEKQFDRLTTEYPDYEGMANVYYHLFLLHSRKGDTQRAEEYVRLLQEQYPDNEWTTILTDPNFMENSRLGVHMEDSLYAATYEAFKANRSQEVDANVVISDTRFPLGANRDKFVFIGGLSKLNNGDVEGCLTAMNTVVEKYPNSRISEMAGMIVNGVKAGKSIHGGKFDLDDVWSRRTAVFNDSDSIAARKLSDERNTEFLFVIAYSPDSVNENQLLYQMARFNFTSFIVRNFDITIEGEEGVRLMQISGLRNFDEAHQYAQQAFANQAIMQLTKKARILLISRPNLELLGKQFSYSDYEEFYTKHFAPLKVTDENLLDEPTEIGYEKEPDLQPRRNDTDPDDGGFSDDEPTTPATEAETGFDIDEPATPQQKEPGGFDIDEPAAPQQEEPGGFDIDEPESEPTGTDVDEGAVIDDTEEPVRQPEPTKQPEPTPATPTPATPATEDDGGFDLEGDDDGGFDIDDGGFDLEDDTNGFNLEDDDDTGSSVEDDGGAVIEDDAPAANPKKPADDNNDIDDEYFDLEGF